MMLSWVLATRLTDGTADEYTLGTGIVERSRVVPTTRTTLVLATTLGLYSLMGLCPRPPDGDQGHNTHEIFFVGVLHVGQTW